MKCVLILAAALIIALSSQVFAALGNSESQIADLFGKPAQQGFPDKNGITTNVYQKGDYTILVQFLRHYSLAESYTRVDKHEFSDIELSAFLEGSSNEWDWIKDPNKLAWEREDHKARAWCETLSGRPTLLIQAK
jgi:hypothetical protein